VSGYEVDLCKRMISHCLFGDSPANKYNGKEVRNILSHLFTKEQIDSAFAELSTPPPPKEG